MLLSTLMKSPDAMAVHTRIAPTPSGYLHTGNVFSFLYTKRLLQNTGDTLRLRIDDLDRARMRNGYLEDIFETLEWLGIKPDSGASNPHDFKTQYSQTLRVALYRSYIEQLKQKGHLYACNCSRKDILQKNKKGIYPGTCRLKNLSLLTPGTAIRLRIPEDTVPISFIDAHREKTISIHLLEDMGDFVIQRKEGLPAYHIASLADDVLYGTNTIVRGEDLLESTAAQLFLAGLLNLDVFLQTKFYHHPLVQHENGEKLSKSAGHLSLKHLRKTGMPAQQVTALFEKWLQTIA